MGGWTYAMLAAALAAGILLWLALRRKNRKSKVTNISAYRNLKQKCSYCKKKSEKLIFYSNAEGQVVGLCKACKPKAERQDMLPI
ncbi:hypothetical protein [Paenibacillus sp. MBLB4367]|uniref:hypothetical protein n=1 Tax=Paenibacillus sp. MBLB4367 TaxID=3384767 RepID=UPI003907F533